MSHTEISDFDHKMTEVFDKDNDKDNRDQFIKDKAQYLNKNLDHARYSDRLDEDLFAQFLNFYNQAIQ